MTFGARAEPRDESPGEFFEGQVFVAILSWFFNDKKSQSVCGVAVMKRLVGAQSRHPQKSGLTRPWRRRRADPRRWQLGQFQPQLLQQEQTSGSGSVRRASTNSRPSTVGRLTSSIISPESYSRTTRGMTPPATPRSCRRSVVLNQYAKKAMKRCASIRVGIW